MDGERWRNPWCKLEPHPGAERLVVVFSHIHEPKGRFSLYHSFRAVPAHRLFVNAPGNVWYRNGIPGLGDSVEQTAASLALLASTLSPRTVVTAGCSMGGYAALLFGALLGADAMLAFGPETLLKLPGSRSGGWTRHLPESPYDDLLPILAQRPGGGRVSILAGEADVIDLQCAVRVRHLPGVEARTLRGSGHEVAETLHRAGALRPLLEDFVRDGRLPDSLPGEGSILTMPGAVDDLVEGRRLRLAGRRDEAAMRLRRCLSRYPDATPAHDDLGLIAAAHGDAAAAERHHRRAVSLSPRQAGPQENLGLALNAQKRFAEAEDALRRALEVFPAPQLRIPLGLSLWKQGRTDEAEEMLRAALVANPRLAWAHFHLGEIAAGRGDHPGAEAAYRAAIARSPRNASFHHRLALVLAAQGRTGEAVAALEEAIAVNPHNPGLRRELHRLHDAAALAA